jgi:hypothetical protein
MYSNILYVSATTCLVIGSALSFNDKEVSDYFFLIGSSLFLVKACLCLAKEIKANKIKSGYTTI